MVSIVKSLQKWNWIPFLLVLCLFLYAQRTTAQPEQVYASVVFWKVSFGQGPEFEKIMKENLKSAHQIRKESGKILSWALYSVHNTGTLDDYNYVAVSYYSSWDKTEPNENFQENVKKANPSADPAAILAKVRSIATRVRVALYSRVDLVEAKTATPSKYVLLNFMKVNNGMFAEYLKAEQEEWKPMHQALVDGGSRAGWGLWQLVLPGGTNSSHDYVTANVYSNYSQINSESYENAFKKVHAEKDMQAMFDRTAKSRDLVKAELWELIDSL
jgi:hypothetical protein